MEVCILNDNTAYIYDYIANECGNELGACALLGNLEAESGIIPIRLQGDFTSDLSKSVEYTDKVDNGEITRDTFIHDSKGYGLAQWTFSTRKAGLYDLAKSLNTSIGDTNTQCIYLVQELKTSYPTVWNAMCNAADLETVSNIILHQFENPADQSRRVELYRLSLCQEIYNIYYKGVIPPKPLPPAPIDYPTLTGNVLLLACSCLVRALWR